MKKKQISIMGILNITPDSFSDGGLYIHISEAMKHVDRMIRDGVDIIDIGAESTRPGSLPVSAKDQIKRIVPVLKKIRQKYGPDISISVDTNQADVAEAAIKHGATMINALGGFMFDQTLAEVVAKYNIPIVIYHINGNPQTMQVGVRTSRNIMSDLKTFFENQILMGKKYGIKRKQFILDPGIGFGKSVADNLTIIKKLHMLSTFKLPVLIGVSRKSHIGLFLKEVLGLDAVPTVHQRLEGGLAETAIAVSHGATIVRTHDVLETRKFLAIFNELR